MDKLEKLLKAAPSRRTFMAGIGAASATVVVAGCSSSSVPTVTPTPTTAPAPGLTAFDILNFALNLEYLEASFYLFAATGAGIPTQYLGASPGTITGGAQVDFTGQPVLQAYANEIAQDELNHVIFLRTAIAANGGTPVDCPAINFTDTFNTVASAAGIGSTFNPFADPQSFLVGAFVFEDVGVTAYHGGASVLHGMISTAIAASDTATATLLKSILTAAASIHAVEAYHAGEIRTLIAGMASVTGASQAYLSDANKIIAVRAALGGNAETTLSTSSIVASQPGTSIGFSRNTDQVLHIVYATPPGAGSANGGFFPNGLNGTISVTAS